MKTPLTIKSIILVIYYGLFKDFNFNLILRLALKTLGIMLLIASLSPVNPVRFICVFMGIFSLYFGSVINIYK